MNDMNRWVDGDLVYVGHQRDDQSTQQHSGNERRSNVILGNLSTYHEAGGLISNLTGLHERQDGTQSVPHRLIQNNRQSQANVVAPYYSSSQYIHSQSHGSHQLGHYPGQTTISSIEINRPLQLEPQISRGTDYFHERPAPDTAYGQHLSDASTYRRPSSSSSSQVSRGQATYSANRLSGLSVSREEGSVNRRRRDSAQDVEEVLDPDYRLREKPRKFFVLGKVFSCVWTEPAGDTSTAAPSSISEIRFGQTVHTKVRKFVVIRTGLNSCVCIPILTYSRQGVARRGSDKALHAIIFTGRTAPAAQPDEAPIRGETGMLPDAIRVDPDTLESRLDPMSRLNFGKLYTIEHNIKVKSFGRVNRASMQSLTEQFKRVLDLSEQPQISRPNGRPIGLSLESLNLHDAIHAERLRAIDVLRVNRFTEEVIQALLGGRQTSRRAQTAHAQDPVPAQPFTSENGVTRVSENIDRE